MGQIMSNVVKKVKEAISLSFFHILLGDYLSKKQWLQNHLSRNLWQLELEMPNFKDVRANFLPLIWVKNGEKTDNIQ